MIEQDGSSVVDSLDQHSCHNAQQGKDQEAEFAFAEAFQDEKLGPVHLRLGVGRVSELVGAFSLETLD